MTSLLIALLLLGPTTQGPRDLQIPNEIKPPRIVPSGSVIPVNLMTEVSTRNAKVGDGVYARTVFPITVDNEIVIPVGTYVDGIPEAIGRTGKIVPVGDIDLLTEAIKETLSWEDERGGVARKRIVEHFPISKRIERLKGIIAEL